MLVKLIFIKQFIMFKIRIWDTDQNLGNGKTVISNTLSLRISVIMLKMWNFKSILSAGTTFAVRNKIF